MGFMSKLLGEGSGRYRGQLKSLIDQERDSDRMWGDAASAQLETGLKARLGGYDQAIQKTSDVSRSARREAGQRSTRAGADLVQRLGAGGKFGTTALDNARMGLQSSLTDDLDEIDASFSGLFADLATGRGDAEAVGRGAMADLDMMRSDQESELIRLLQSTLRPTRGGMLGGILGAGGAALGSMLGGPAGGALGGEIGSAVGSGFERD